MKRHLLTLITLAAALIGCQMEEFDNGYNPESNLKKVRLTATMPSVDTKAALATRNGHFSWQENDQISVLATDGKFYTLSLASGADTHQAVFEGSISESASMTTVAVYPPMLENGADNTIYDAATGKLTYTLATEYDYVEGNTNVPMIATIAEGSTPETATASFKQIGSVIRFPINALPKKAKIVLTVKNNIIAMPYEVVPSEAGTTELSATSINGVTNTVTVNYASDYAGRTAEINIPVPTGVYGECAIEVFDENGESLVQKDYDLNREIKRATLLIMNAIDAGPMTISEVWPFFVDARVLFSKFAGVDKYAIYIDDIVNPVVVRGEEVDGNMQALIGGDFAHNSTHTIKVAKVVDGIADVKSMSEPVTFTTGNVRQMTYNTGTKFICAGWDDVAIGIENSTVYNEVTQRWSNVPKDDAISGRNIRGYRVQLYAEDKTTLLYDEVPFSGQCDYGGAISNSSWFGKIGGANVLLPTALTFGWLEPGKTYYFRVQTLDEAVSFTDPDSDCFEPGTEGYTISSPRGGCAWSEMVAMKTDPEYTLGASEIFHEGFDDMMLNSDIMNMCSAAVPQILTEATKKSDYENRKSATKYKGFVALPHEERSWSEQGFNTMLHAYEHGLTDDNYSDEATPRTLNEYAGSLEGWSIISGGKNRHLYPNFGAIRLGESGTAKNAVELRSSALEMEGLSAEKATKCIVKVKVSATATTTTSVISKIAINQYRNYETGLSKIDSDIIDFSLDEDGNISPEWSANYYGTAADEGATEYIHTPVWFEVKGTFYLKNGDIIGFERVADATRGMLIIGDISIELDPTDDGSGINRYYGTAPDNTDYDVWDIGGDMPVTFWMGPPALDATDFSTLSSEQIAELKTAYFDPMVDCRYNLIEISNPYPESMKTILKWCEEAGVKLIDKSIGNWSTAKENITAQMDRIAEYADMPAHSGGFVGIDEPGACMFIPHDAMNDAYKTRFSNKARTINLFPSYANATQLRQGNSCVDESHNHNLVSNYAQYIKYFADNVDVNCYMFDHYCLQKATTSGGTKRGKVKSKQYYDLDIIRHYSLEKRVPFLQITHGRPQWDAGYKVNNGEETVVTTTEKPTEHVYDEQRWLVWSQIALGSKGVSYFCYWSPAGFTGGPFSWTSDGVKTRMYDILQDINEELQPIGRILMKCHADGAIMTNPSGNFILYENDGMGLSNYGPVLELTKGNEEDVVAGCFRDASTGEYKVLVIHKAPATNDNEAATASIANLKLDRAMVSKVKLHTVTLGADKASPASTVVSEQIVSDGALTLSIPDGTAVLVEFPETANQSYN